LFVAATVVSVNRENQVTVDAGTKALATNGPPPHTMLGVAEGAVYGFAGDEHGYYLASEGSQAAVARPADNAWRNCDPTVNLHACYQVADGTKVEIWPIAARYGWRDASI
jgi:D-serine deaminase-like pyridoxal phosphate-dependent protein